jgi:SAM-dependent methyltransferase
VKGDDAFGRALLDWVELGRAGVVVERDDGFVFQEGGRDFYAAPFRRWEAHERQGLRFARGRVLDAGCGSGRVARELQRRGRDVVGIDLSPLAIEAARRLGVRDARVLALAEVGAELGSFDSIVLYGNNLGLLESPAKAQRILRRLHAVTTPRGRIVGSSMDIAAGEDADHRAYVARNVERGRPPGQVRLRVRYRKLVGPWFDWLFLATTELEALLTGSGWRIARTLDATGDRYVAVIEKD